MTPEAVAAIAGSIAGATGRPCRIDHAAPVSGGCIHRSFRLDCGNRTWFVKLNDAASLPLFEAEAEGLIALGTCTALAVPEPVAVDTGAGCAWIVMTWLDLAPDAADAALGHGLAQLHRIAAAGFGWRRDNWIGATPQHNAPTADAADWAAFFGDRRLAPQFARAARRGDEGRRLAADGEALLAVLPTLLAGHAPLPSLLHGDLWRGNAAATRDGRGAVFDPAPYYGDRETDLAMTELFGGFSPDFTAAYRAVWPVDAGYAVRRDLYNLYHMLNHFHLFGGAYGDRARRLVARLRAEA